MSNKYLEKAAKKVSEYDSQERATYDNAYKNAGSKSIKNKLGIATGYGVGAVAGLQGAHLGGRIASNLSHKIAHKVGASVAQESFRLGHSRDASILKGIETRGGVKALAGAAGAYAGAKFGIGFGKDIINHIRHKEGVKAVEKK